jgi:hypothetical protein
MSDPKSAEAAQAAAAMLHRFGDEAMTLGLLRGDPLYRYIVPGTAQSMVAAALAEGRSRAAWMKTIYGNDLLKIAERLNVPIRSTDIDSGWGSTVVFAQYETRPVSITLYRPAIERVERVLREVGMDIWLRTTDLCAIFIAHELYHHLESSSLATPLSKRYRVDLVRIGPWCWRGGLVSLDEIGAGAFAQALLGLPRHPRLLDMLCIYDADPETIVRIASELRADGASLSEEDQVQLRESENL